MQDWSPDPLTSSPACYHCATDAPTKCIKIHQIHLIVWKYFSLIQCNHNHEYCIQHSTSPILVIFHSSSFQYTIVLSTGSADQFTFAQTNLILAKSRANKLQRYLSQISQDANQYHTLWDSMYHVAIEFICHVAVQEKYWYYQSIIQHKQPSIKTLSIMILLDLKKWTNISRLSL